MNPILLLLLLFCWLPASPSVASDAAAQAEIIALEIRNLSTSVDRLTQLLYQQQQQQSTETILRKLDIAVAYLNFRSRRIEMLERDKQRNETTKVRLEDVIQQLEGRVAQLEDSDETDPAAIEANKTTREETLEQLKILKQRLERVDEKLITYDNQIIELSNQLDDVEAFVERNLEL